MNIKGLDQLRKHVPDLNSPLGIFSLILLPVIALFLVSALYAALRMALPFWQLVAEILLGGLGFGLLYLFFRNRQDFRSRFGPLAYNRAARWFGLPGVTLIAAVIARLRDLPGPVILAYGWDLVLTVLGWVFIVAAVILALRTVQIFGVDNLTMVYVYFPEESQLVNQKIYDILRHPAYAAVQWLAFGLALLNGGLDALACALVFALGLWAWVHFVEEKELIRRFGASYVEYRKRVPAFWPRLRNLRDFAGFLLVGK